jgi:hypothetical protein
MTVWEKFVFLYNFSFVYSNIEEATHGPGKGNNVGAKSLHHSEPEEALYM